LAWFRDISKPSEGTIGGDLTSKSPFSGWPKAVFFVLMLIFAGHACTHMVAAGDTWVALACGRHFYNHGVDTVEPFSANSHHAGPTDEDLKHYPKIVTKLFSPATIRYWHPTGWINQNWLTHLFFYWLSAKSPIADAETRTFNSLVYWKFTIYILSMLSIYYAARLLKADVAPAAVFTAAALFIGRSFLDIRPAGFSNLLVAVFLVILLLTTYRNILYIWLVVPLVVLWCNLHGGYIYVFFMMAPFIFLNLVTIPSKRLFVSIGMKGVIHSVAASVVAFVAMVIFNPFHLTNLTHTFVISFSKYAKTWREVNEWHGAFEWSNPVGTGVPFLVMFILLLVLLAVWFILMLLNPESGAARRREKKAAAGGYSWPKADMAILAVAMATVYMAIKSRRFIPIAAFVACPVMAMLLDQIIRMAAARRRWVAERTTELPGFPKGVRAVIIAMALAAVAFFGGWWGWKLKKVYLDPWPSEATYTSVFMRMTASNVKPFEACDFIRENKLSGKMFNYWTEGGAISWGQDPDPVTGKTPLQLFMDGRAQAAYDASVYARWGDIMSGGPAAVPLYYSHRRPTEGDYQAIGKWIGDQLALYDVWVVLMPGAEFNDPEKYFTDALERNPEWRCAYYDAKQKMLVRVSQPEGNRIFTEVMTDQAKFPNEFCQQMSVSNWLVRIDDEPTNREGLRRAKIAFDLNPSQEPLAAVIATGRRESLRSEVDKICRDWLGQFETQKSRYEAEDGYRLRLTAALMAADHLIRVTTDGEERKACQALRDKWILEFKELNKWMRW